MKSQARLAHAAVFIVGFACVACFASGPSVAEVAHAASVEAMRDDGHAEINLGVGKSRLVQLPSSYTDVMVGDPKIADVVPLNPHTIYIVGKGMGSTVLTVYGAGKRMIMTANVVVSADLEGFKARMHEIIPGETDVAVHPANQSVVLSGTVSSPAVLKQVLDLADTYSPGKVVNMMTVQGTQQVMLSVRFVEMERTVAKDLRLNVQQTPTNTGPQVTVTSGDSLNFVAQNAMNTFGTASLLWNVAGGNFSVLFDALEQKGLIKTLAEPTLVAMSGDTANFLAGGEFPIPVAQSAGGITGVLPTITIEYKQFGISLAFTPTILQDGLINMVVNPEVSSIDPTTSVQLGDISIPGIKVRRAHTTVELRDGESFTVAGLLADDYQNNIRQFPFIGDIPILGALFRSTSYQSDQTELVIVVTPHLVTPRKTAAATPADQFVPPSDFELFLFGAQRGNAADLRPEDRALMSIDPTKGGVDGAYGHVLY
jgi:pilus assembly protein CpaC